MLIEDKFYKSAVEDVAGVVRALNEAQIPAFRKLFVGVVEEALDVIAEKFQVEIAAATGRETKTLVVEAVREEIEALAESLPSRSLVGQKVSDVRDRAILENYAKTKQCTAETARVLGLTEKSLRAHVKRLGVYKPRSFKGYYGKQKRNGC
jgi:transcriptional regulator with GAF, ATPase, and Fis domain